jgi:two-component system LytT family sensor kinase
VLLTRRRLALIALFWAFFGWLYATQLYLALRAETNRPPSSYGRIVVWQVGCWLLWALATPIVFWMTRRFPLAARPRPIIAHLAAGILIALVRAGGDEIVSYIVKPFPSSGHTPLLAWYAGILSSTFHFDLLIYWATVGVIHAFESRERLRERELHTSRVEAQLAGAQLENLRLRVQPHFLFNTLHSIASLVRDDHRHSAVTMIAGLSDLLRYSLENATRTCVPLSEELEVVQRYLEIEQTRFSDRLSISVDATDETKEAVVPTLILQPIIENALRHGIARLVDGGRVEVRARRDDGALVLEVSNDGPPLREDWNRGEGIGLSNTRARLQQLYGSNAVLELQSRLPTGVVARIRIPFSTELRHD